MTTPGLNRRIKVSTQTRAVNARGEHAVLMVAIGARSALLLAAGPLGEVGQTLDLYLPAFGEDLMIACGVEHTERIADGFVVTVEYMVVDQKIRRSLEMLLGLLLQGDGGGERRHPRIRHQIAIVYGERNEKPAQLELISLSGLGMSATEALPVGTRLKISLPDMYGGIRLALRGVVVNQKAAENGFGYQVGVAFDKLEPALHEELNALLIELVRG